MRELNAFLAAEGPTDHCFLPTVIERALIEIVRDHHIAVAQVQSLWVTVKEGMSKHQAVCRAAQQAASGMSLLFYHYDGSANPDREAAKYWDPLRKIWPDQGPARRPLVRVVPVREMESWALADQEALRVVARRGWDGADVFEMHKLPNVESLTDPKRTLNELLSTGRGRRRSNRRPEDVLPRIAELLSLTALRRLPSFRMWTTECLTALRDSGFLA